jgi:hypothetical protein
MHWTELHEHEIFNHYIALVQKPGWKAYAWRRIEELDRDSSKTGFHKGIKERFLEKMKATT